jgi:DNA invertase Pin-like site-specific DNA recombinase
MLRIYCRTSKVRKEKYTIENQKDNGIKCAQKLGVPYRIYVDDGISGTTDDSIRGG